MIENLLHWAENAPAPDPAAFGLPGSRPDDDTLALGPGAIRLFACAGPRGVFAGHDPGAVVGAARAVGHRFAVTPRAVSHMLHHGFVPAPDTIRGGLFRLGLGDRLTLRRKADGFTTAADHSPPFLNVDSRQDGEPSTARLLELLVGAVDRTLGPFPGVLMLSSGKDSVALALACREAGRADVRAITFASQPDEPEAVDASALARRLGMPHEVVVLPDAREEIEPIVAAGFEAATEPCGDPTLVPYLLGAARAELGPGHGLIDGLNNDSYVGYVPSRAEHDHSRVADRWLSWLRPLRGWIPVEHPLSAALRTRAEWHFFGGRWFRHADTRRFYAASIDTHAEWARVCGQTRDLDDFDFRSVVRGRHADQNAMIEKAFVVSEITGARAVFPFTDPQLTDYCFHLPEPSRFDRENLVNKVLLRELLRERLDYDDARIGKRTFHFDGPRFLTAHRAWIESEILACPLWMGAVESIVSRQLDRPAALRKTWPSLMALFQLSGWLNRHPEECDA